MISVYHYSPRAFGRGRHKGPREQCLDPGCAWPSKGDLATGVHGGVERTGEVVGLGSFKAVLRTSDGSECAVSHIRKPDWGAYCIHGLKIVEAVPAEHSCTRGRQVDVSSRGVFYDIDRPACLGCHPEGRVVEPWPCTRPECTREAYEQAMQTEIDAYHEDAWQTYYGN